MRSSRLGVRIHRSGGCRGLRSVRTRCCLKEAGPCWPLL
jgi:hypothetical protein